MSSHKDGKPCNYPIETACRVTLTTSCIYNFILSNDANAEDIYRTSMAREANEHVDAKTKNSSPLTLPPTSVPSDTFMIKNLDGDAKKFPSRPTRPPPTYL